MDGILKSADGGNWVAETIDFRSSDPHAILNLGISKSAITNRAQRGLSWSLGQLYGVVATGLINVEHIFQGLRRRLSVNGDGDADEKKYVFTWSAKRDARLGDDGVLKFFPAPLDDHGRERVFFVIVSPNVQSEKFPDIFGWIEWWGWLPSHAAMRGAPVDYDSRYDSRIWSS